MIDQGQRIFWRTILFKPNRQITKCRKLILKIPCYLYFKTYQRNPFSIQTNKMSFSLSMIAPYSAGSLRKQEYSRISKVPQRCHRLPLEWPLRRFAAFAISSLSIGRLPPDFTSSLVTSYSTSVPILEVIRAVLLKSRFCSDTFGNHCTKSYLNSHLFCWLVALKL